MESDLDLGLGVLDTDHVVVRQLEPSDLGWVVAIDQEHSGLARPGFYSRKLEEGVVDSDVRISLAAEVDGAHAGFLMGRLYYGEFGIPEPVALLDAIGVSAGFAGQKVGRALLRQLAMNLNALNISTLRTEVDWEQGELMSFFRHAGFRPSTRICLDASVADIND